GAATSFFGQNYQFDPEYTNNYELALRSQWFDKRLTVNANIFLTDWVDQQVSQQVSPNPLDTIIVNAGESQIYGGELEVSANPVAGLEVFAAIGYAKTEFTDFMTGGDDFTGNVFPFAPEWTASFGGEYFFENGIFIGMDASYTDGSFRDIENTPELDIPSRFLVNARLGYEFGNWGIFAYVSNAFDKQYWNRRDDDGTLRPGDPRQYGVVINWSL
ncbi:MAG: TonB-dependent receptor, partial [Verrucomicrobiota bacterium]